MTKINYSQFAMLIYMNTFATNWEMQLGGKDPHLTKLPISEWSTFNRRVKRSDIDPKEILTIQWSNMYRCETAFCLKYQLGG